MKKLIAMALLGIIFPITTKELLFQDTIRGKQVSIHFDSKTNQYTFSEGVRAYNYPHTDYQKLLERHQFGVKRSDFKNLKTQLSAHYNTLITQTKLSNQKKTHPIAPLTRPVSMKRFHLLFQDTVRGNKVRVNFDSGNDQYIFTIGDKTYQYPRDEYSKLMTRHLLDLNPEDIPTLTTRLRNHSILQGYAKPGAKEMLKDALLMRDQALAIANRTVDDDCAQRKKIGPYNTALTITRVSYRNDTMDEINFNQQLMKKKMNQDGFFGLGELTGLTVHLMTANDNILHGALTDHGAGITKHGKKPEGDDRGETLGIDVSAQLAFEKGGITVSRYTTGYSRLVKRPTKIKIGNQSFNIMSYTDKDGRSYQEFLTIDGVKVAIRREFGTNKVYAKVVGKREVLSDKGGLALKIQEAWHKKFMKNKTYQYNNVPHVKDRVRYGAEIGIGKEIEIATGEHWSTKGNIYLGRQFSTGGDENRYITAQGHIELVYATENINNNKYPSWEARLYTEGKYYDDGEQDIKAGVQVTKRWHLSRNGYFYLTTGVAHDDNRNSRDFGQEEIERNGSIDLQHYYGLGYEYKF